MARAWLTPRRQMLRFFELEHQCGTPIQPRPLPGCAKRGGGVCAPPDRHAAASCAAQISGHPVTAVIARSFGVMAALLASRDHGFSIPKLVSIGAFESCRWFIDAAKNHLALSDDVATRIRDNFEARHGYRIT